MAGDEASVSQSLVVRFPKASCLGRRLPRRFSLWPGCFHLTRMGREAGWAACVERPDGVEGGGGKVGPWEALGISRGQRKGRDGGSLSSPPPPPAPPPRLL